MLPNLKNATKIYQNLTGESPITVNRKIRKDIYPAIRIGSKFFVEEATVQNWLESLKNQRRAA